MMKQLRLILAIGIVFSSFPLRAETTSNSVSVKLRFAPVSQALISLIKISDHSLLVEPSVASVVRTIDFTATNAAKEVVLSSLIHEIHEQCAVTIEKKADDLWAAKVDDEFASRLPPVLPAYSKDFSADQERLQKIADEIHRRRDLRQSATGTLSEAANSSDAASIAKPEKK